MPGLKIPCGARVGFMPTPKKAGQKKSDNLEDGDPSKDKPNVADMVIDLKKDAPNAQEDEPSYLGRSPAPTKFETP